MIRLHRLTPLLPVLGALVFVAACSSDDGSSPPPGVACSETKSAGDSDAARAALSGAASGSCVVLSGGAYSGAFDVPAGVALVSGSGSRAVLSGAAVSLAEGSTLAALDVTDATGVGVAVRAASAKLLDVKVTGAKSAAVAVQCKEASCAAGTISLEGVTLEKSGIGLWVSGAHVVMNGGASNEHGGSSLTGGLGVVAQDGARLELDGVTVSKNQGAGVLVDGEKTTASIRGATISENAERGIWTQRVAGTLEAPAVEIKDSAISKNRIVGVGGVESRGIIIVGGRVADTQAAPVVTNLAQTEEVGDGIGIFGGSTDFKIDQTLLESNARAAGVVDGSDRGIIIVGGKVSAGASGLKFVVQNSSGADVQIASGDKSEPAKALGVSAPKLSVPSVLP